MSTAGRHAARDGSFARSTGAAAGRGALLLAVAVVLGVVLLNAADDAPPGSDLRTSRPAEENGVAATTSTSEPAPTETVPPARNPAEVKVLVANGSGVAKAAAQTSDRLKPGGWNLLAPVDGSSTEATSIFYVEGYAAEAASIAEALGRGKDAVKPMPEKAPVGDLRGAHVLVLVGPELAREVTGSGAAGSSTASTTSTTAKA